MLASSRYRLDSKVSCFSMFLTLRFEDTKNPIHIHIHVVVARLASGFCLFLLFPFPFPFPTTKAEELTLATRPEMMGADAVQGMYKAIVEFIQVEYIGGSCEGGQGCEFSQVLIFFFFRGCAVLKPHCLVLRNKLAFTISQLFLRAFPSHIPTFLHPFFALLSPPTSSPPNLHPQFLTIRLLLEIAQEIHDTTLKTARIMTKERQERDGVVRDVIRSSGDDKTAVEGMLGIIEKGLEQINSGTNSDKWAEAVDATLKTLSAWIRKCFYFWGGGWGGSQSFVILQVLTSTFKLGSTSASL